MPTEFTKVAEDQAKEEVIKMIVQIVTDMNGCKATELAAKFMEVPEVTAVHRGSIFGDILHECIERGLLVEVEYVLPHIDYRIKSFLLPAGTSCVVKRRITTNRR